MGESPFLAIAPAQWVAENDLAFAIRDRFPVSPGHTLVVPKRLVATWFDASSDEQRAILALVDVVKQQLDRELSPDGYNVGFNAGEAAGQTVMHLHVHVIPRFHGDMRDPRGGIRGAIPWKQKYDHGSPGKDKPFAQLPRFVHGDDVHLERALLAALQDAEAADLLSAFVQTSGVDLLYQDLRDALRRGVTIRLLTGDYFGVTRPDALRKLLTLSDEHAGFKPFFYETAQGESFHPKAYLFFRGGEGVAYVGSSNLSETALRDGIEWNLRLVSSEDGETFQNIARRFQVLLDSPRTKRLDRALIDAYEARAPEREVIPPEPRAPPPVPTSLQREALVKLSEARRDGARRGLVVLATGLGKTFLSAFDFRAMDGKRALFIAHREEILEQAKDTWQRVFPEKVTGLYHGDHRDDAVDLLFASIQTLSRTAHLARFAPRAFDYVVVDEFHHAAASTYRKVLGHFDPRFLLGLTATPERMDGHALLDLCDDRLVFRKDLTHGIAAELLVPFRYFGVKDSVDFEPIPWRSGRFDAEALTTALATEARASQSLAEYERHAPTGPRRTLVFCTSTAHADFMADFFRRQGKQAVAVHSGPSSAPRAESLRQLRAGALELVCAVDIFNEGVDLPDVNTVLMLRPTESPVIFLQQLGRGLRRADGKRELVVVDFIGNHRSFLTKTQSLMFLLGQELPPRVALDRIEQGTLELPPGCSVEIQTEALDLLRSLLRESPTDALLYEYATLRDALGRRPSAGELFCRGVTFLPIKSNHPTWFDFVDDKGDLSDDERRVVGRHRTWLRDLLVTKMSKSYKMLALRALIDADCLFTGTSITENARRAFESVRPDLLLFREMREDEGRRELGSGFERRWHEMPLRIWARGEDTSERWFTLEDDRFAPAFQVAEEDRAVFEAMTEEMIELRLAEHRDRLMRRPGGSGVIPPLILDVSHSRYRPILRFDRERQREIPSGPTTVWVRGRPYVFEFMKIAVNVAREPGGHTNVLPELLRALFGPATGQPGIRHRARLLERDDGWHLDKEGLPPRAVEGAEVIPFPRLPFYADVRVACGLMEAATQQSDAIQELAIVTDRAVDPARHFVVRADGDSMNGGDEPIEDGDLVLCEWARGVDAHQVEGRAFVVTGSDAADTSFAMIKIPRRRAGAWSLESTNPAFPAQQVPAAAVLTPVARVLGVVRPALGLRLYGEYDRDVIAAAFGGRNDPSWKVGHRDVKVGDVEHTVLMVTLRKAGKHKIEHRYADRFVSPGEMEWDSQASTSADSLKGRRIRGVEPGRRVIHLFAQYDSHQKFRYLGPVRYLSHEGERPMHVRFALEQPLPDELWKLWGGP